MEYARVEETLNHPLPAIWAMISAFGAIKAWIEGIESCELEGNGPGAVRTIRRGGSIVREHLDAIDSTTHTISYTLIPPYRLPATGVRATIRLTRIDDTHTAVKWWSEADELLVPREEIGGYIEAFYRTSLGNLDTFLKR